VYVNYVITMTYNVLINFSFIGLLYRYQITTRRVPPIYGNYVAAFMMQLPVRQKVSFYCTLKYFRNQMIFSTRGWPIATPRANGWISKVYINSREKRRKNWRYGRHSRHIPADPTTVRGDREWPYGSSWRPANGSEETVKERQPHAPSSQLIPNWFPQISQLRAKERSRSCHSTRFARELYTSLAYTKRECS
jgi:hypothetical protein